MSLPETPFDCTEENSTMKFINEDHLNSHQRNHSVSFNLELAEKNNETAILLADDTPTPTSFFRNCEEVGLFQDLQNVNPFEETFKKALENCDNNTHKLDSLSLVTCEDTLHTPHVFPLLEEASDKNIVSDNELSIVNFVEIPHITEKIEILSGIDSNIKVREKQENFRHKLKETLLKKDRKKYIQNKQSLAIDASERAKLMIAHGIAYVSEKDFTNKNSNYTMKPDKVPCGKLIISTDHRSSIEKVREMNRAAQMRCRVKKKRYYDRVSEELIHLKKENVELKNENAQLRENIFQLWKIIEELGGIKETYIINDAKVINENKAQETNLKKLPALAPAGKVLLNKSLAMSPQPVVYNLVPVQVLNTGPNLLVGSLTVPKFVPGVKTSKFLPRILKKT